MSAEATFLEFLPRDEVLYDNLPRKTLLTHITITNITNKRVTFKIKTTSPKKYVVKPNHGIMPANQSVRIEFAMQPTEGLPSDSNLNDKFMILATDLDENFEIAKLADIWKEKQPSQIQQHRVRVTFKGVEPPPERKSAGMHRYEQTQGTPDRMKLSQGINHKLYSSAEPQMYQSAVSLKVGAPDNGLSAFGKDKKDYDKMAAKLEEYERNLNIVKAERDKLAEELVTLKQTLANKLTAKATGSFQFWQMLLVCVLSLIIGAFLSA